MLFDSRCGNGKKQNVATQSLTVPPAEGRWEVEWQHEALKICTVKDTAWSLLLEAWQMAAAKQTPHKVAAQETKLAKKSEVRKARDDMETQGRGSGFGEALVNENNGHARRMAILWDTAIARSEREGAPQRGATSKGTHVHLQN